MSVDVLPAVPVELRAANLLGEAGDADDVGGLQVLHEEVAAGLGHVLELEPCQEGKQGWNGPAGQQLQLQAAGIYLTSWPPGGGAARTSPPP